MKAIELQLGKFLDVIQKKITPQDKLNQLKNTTEWFKNGVGDYSKSIDVQEKKKHIR